MFVTKPLRRFPGAIPQGQPQLDPNGLYMANTRSRWLLGSNIAFDVAGSNNGTITGGATIVPGINGNEINFNSAGRNVTINKISPIFVPPFTAVVSATCIAVPATSTFSGLLGFPGASAKLSIGIGNDVSGATVFGTWNNTAIEYDATTGLTVSAGMRFVVALIATTTTLSLLMFDVAHGLRTWSISESISSITLTGGANWVLGSDSFGAPRFWPGTLSQVILLNNIALSVPQFLYIAQNPFTDLIFHSDFNIGMFGGASGGGSFSGSVAESMSFADTVSTTAQFNPTIAETLALTDSPSTTAHLLSAISEALVLTDSLSAGGSAFTAAITESLGLTDAPAANAGLVAAITEVLSLADTSAGQAKVVAAIIEALALTDIGTVTTAHLLAAIAEQMIFADAPDSSGGISTAQRLGLLLTGVR